MLDVCLLGCGGMMPLPYRWLTSLMLRYNGSQLLIDCGEGTQIAMKKKGWSANPIDTLLVTHFHADHISGLPGLLLTMGNAERTEPLTVVGPKGVEKVVRALRTIAPELPFPLIFRELEEAEEEFAAGPYLVSAFRVSHNVPCYGYTVSIPRAGRFYADRAQELGLPVRCWNPLQKGNTVEYEGRLYTPDMVMGPPRRGLKVTYCTDSRPVPVIAQQAKDADLFICEGMYAEEDKDGKARENRHMTFAEAAQLAREADPKELWLTHFSPSLNRPAEYRDAVRRIFPRTKIGHDGMSAVLKFSAEEEEG